MKKILLFGLMIVCAFALIGCADDATTTTTVDSQVEAPKGSDDLIEEIAAQIKAVFED
jgi:uncharacterized membrane protein